MGVAARRVGRSGQRDVARIVSRVLVPIIAVAELCSWYAVLSTNYLGNAIEQSIWTCASALVVVGLVARERGARQRFVGIATALIGAYIVFMSMVDVPMYLHRWRADEQPAARISPSWRGCATPPSAAS